MYLTFDCHNNFGWWMDWLDAFSVSTQAIDMACIHHSAPPPNFLSLEYYPILSLRTDCWPCHVLCMAMLCCAVLCWAGLGWAVLCSVEDSIDDSLDEALLYVTANRVGVFRRGKSKCKVVSTQPVTLAAQHQQLPER
jgi:hypothetical protein